ncbi:MAG: LPXTG cell wall anchor domain-containing protein, partial [Firmicutes bacterium]|nr:LPXTG cell wall anchor domain-containing protein [Bacillota bacterium]
GSAADPAELTEANGYINGRFVDNDDLGLVYGFTTVREEASVVDTDANGAINLKGLDSGIYFLEETKTNDGYNLLDTPVQIDIISTYDEESGVYTASVEYKVDSRTQGSNHVIGVRNSKGSTLPATGGMGTTMLYFGGGALVLCAIVLLITKRRMSVNR